MGADHHFSLARIDLYINGTEILVGEIMHCPASGGGRIIPKGSEKLASDIFRVSAYPSL
jgi:hypothetical protein